VHDELSVYPYPVAHDGEAAPLSPGGGAQSAEERQSVEIDGPLQTVHTKEHGRDGAREAVRCGRSQGALHHGSECGTGLVTSPPGARTGDVTEERPEYRREGPSGERERQDRGETLANNLEYPEHG